MGIKLDIVRWGNSAAVRLPATMLAQMGVRIGDSFDAEVSKDKVTLRVVKDNRTIELTVVSEKDAALSLHIRDRALGDAGAHFGSGRLQSNPNHAEFYQAVIDTIMEFKKGGAAVVYNGTEF